jgi:hypothetical protein
MIHKHGYVPKHASKIPLMLSTGILPPGDAYTSLSGEFLASYQMIQIYQVSVISLGRREMFSSRNDL